MAEYFHESKVKRERMRKMMIRERITDMRQNLPVYTVEEIREHKMPYYEALITNLEGKGLVSSASFLQQLVEFQAEAREEAGPGSNLWTRPQLRDSNKELKYLTDELEKAEVLNSAGEHLHECDTFLRLGIHFAFGNPDWWWLGEQILIQSINVSGSYPTLQGNFEAFSRFAYAKFLIDNLKEYDTAKEQLLIAKRLSASKAQAVHVYFPDERPGTLYMVINYYTYKCYIKEVKKCIPSDYKKAIELAIQAKKRAAEACDKEGETQALLLKGLCEMNTNDAKSAIFSFSKALKLQEGKDDMEGSCKAMIQLAKAYLMDDDTSRSLRILNKLKETAAKFHLNFYLAQAYKTMGEQYLNNGEYAVARRLLHKSLGYFEKQPNNSSEITLVQLLEAVAFGLELFPKYVHLVYNSGNTAGFWGIDNLNKLIDWKDSRKPFWDETDQDTTLADMMAADQQILRPSTLRIEEYKEKRRLEKEARKKKQGVLDNEEQEEKSNNTDDSIMLDGDSDDSILDTQDVIKEGLDITPTEAAKKKSIRFDQISNDSDKQLIEIHNNKEQFLTATPSRNMYEDIQNPNWSTEQHFETIEEYL